MQTEDKRSGVGTNIRSCIFVSSISPTEPLYSSQCGQTSTLPATVRPTTARPALTKLTGAGRMTTGAESIRQIHSNR